MADNPTTLKPSEIEVVEDFNPRSTMDKQKLDELAKSIKQHGLLQPLVVGEKNEQGKYPLVAGHRRMAALKANKAKSIDVKIVSANGNAKALAVTENLQREAVNPIDEAKGFQQVMEAEGLNQKQLAARLGISTSQVSDRLKLLKLPPVAQAGIAGGEVPTIAAPLLAKISQTSEEIAEIAACALASDEFETSVVLASDSEASIFFDDVLAASRRAHSFAVRVDNSMYGILRQLEPTDPTRRALVSKARAAMSDYGAAYNSRPSWTDTDTDAARQYKVLIEHKASSVSTIRIVTDEAFFYDRLEMAVENYEQAAKASRKAQDRMSDQDSEGAAKAERAAKREAERVGRIEAQEYNDRLGEQLRSVTASMEVSLDRIKTLALVILSNNAYNSNPAFGLVLTTPEFHDKDVRVMKDGRSVLKVEPIPAGSADENVKREVLEATSVEQVIGIVFRVLLAAMHVNCAALPSNLQPRYGWTIPGTRISEDADFSVRPQLLQESLALFEGDRLKDIQQELEQLAVSADPLDLDPDEDLTDVDVVVRAEAAAELDELEDVRAAAAEHAESLATGEIDGGSDFVVGGSDVA